MVRPYESELAASLPQWEKEKWEAWAVPKPPSKNQVSP
jgi:hypothetical protein